MSLHTALARSKPPLQGSGQELCFRPVWPRLDPRPVKKLEPTPTVLQSGDPDVIFTNHTQCLSSSSHSSTVYNPPPPHLSNLLTSNLLRAPRSQPRCLGGALWTSLHTPLAYSKPPLQGSGLELSFRPVRPRLNPRPVQKLEPMPTYSPPKYTVLQSIDLLKNFSIFKLIL